VTLLLSKQILRKIDKNASIRLVGFSEGKIRSGQKCSAHYFCYPAQELKPKPNSNRHIPILIATAVIALVCLLQALPVVSPGFDLIPRLEWITYDMRMRLAANYSQRHATNLLAGVFITDQDLKDMSDGTYGYREKFPWPTHYYGMAIRELTRQGAKVVGFDILFELLNPGAKIELPDGTESESDRFFAAELRRASNVVLAAEAEGNIFPADLFRTNSSALGNIYTQKDSDAVLRRVKAFTEYRVWHPIIRRVARGMNLDLSKASLEPGRIGFPISSGGRHEILLNPDGSIKMEEITGQASGTPELPYWNQRIWNLGVVLAARELNLDLDKAVVEPHQIILRGPGSLERRIPTDGQGFFYIDWSLKFQDPRIARQNITQLIRDDHWLHWRQQRETNAQPVVRGKLVVIGSTGTGGNIADLGATPLEKETPLVMKHLNVADSIIAGRFIRKSSYFAETLLIVLMGGISALLTLRLRALRSSLSVALAISLYAALAAFLFVQFRYWLPLVLPPFGAFFMTHVCMTTYRFRVEQKDKRRIRSIFSKIVSPKIVHELLKADDDSLIGARRRVTIYFADIRGFTRMTDEIQEQADEYIREHKLSPAMAEAYLDQQAGDLLATVSLYLSAIADTIKKHDGTLDKYIGDCVLAFWGAPIPNDRHALDCVRAAIDAQRAIYKLNLNRAAENQRRLRENMARAAAGQPPLAMLRLLSLGSGISTGMAMVGLMGSEEQSNYSVLGREVNLASRLEGVSGKARIIISATTYQELQRLDPDLASRCIELPLQEVKGFREAVKIYEVQWQDLDEETRSFDKGILNGTSATPPPQFTATGST